MKPGKFRMLSAITAGTAAYGARVRAAVFDFYGRVCACCGTSERLGIDHINGGGKEHREELGNKGSVPFYAWLGCPGGAGPPRHELRRVQRVHIREPKRRSRAESARR